MRAAILAFVGGVWWLQQQSALPSAAWFALLLALAVLLFLTRRHAVLSRFILLACALLAGFLWAAGMAQVRLEDALPAESEGADIQLVGVVASLPQLHERGERFLFDVERIVTPDAR